MKQQLFKSFAIFAMIIGIVMFSHVSANPGDINTSFDTRAPLGFNGEIKTLAVQGNGKMILGGLFTTYKGISTSKIARLNKDGTMDSSFVVGDGFDIQVNALAIQNDGKILVGGNFTTYKGSATYYITRLNTDGTKDNSFISGYIIDGNVNSIVIQNDGKILVGGNFTTYSGTTANRLIRLNSDGTRDNFFDIGNGFNNTVNSITVQNDDKILVGGNFTTYQGSTANRFIRLNSDGTKDNSFNIGIGFNNTINALAIQSDGKILVGGNFTTYSGTTINRLIRLNINGYKDSSFNIGSGFDWAVFTLALQNDGKIFIGGAFTTYSGVTEKNLIRINTDGTKDLTYNIGGYSFNNTVNFVTVQSGGNVLAVGPFTTYKGISANRIVSLNSDGTRDSSFDIGDGFDGNISNLAVQSDGKVLVGGSFTTYEGVSANKITRLNVDGTKDNSFNIGIGFNNTINALAIQSDGKILVGGNFTNYSGSDTYYITRLNSDGTRDTSFSLSGFNSYVYSIAVQNDGKILVGGLFTKYSRYSGITQNYITRLNTDGTLDNTFVGSGFDGTVKVLSIESGGKILVGGQFTKHRGISTNRIVRLNADGTRDSSFDIGGGFDYSVNAIKVQNDGKILIGGSFTTYSGVTERGFIRLNNDGTKDITYKFGPYGFNNTINTIAIQGDGKILIGGAFQNYPGRVVRLNTDGTQDFSFNDGYGFNDFVNAIALQSNGNILVGGLFTNYQGILASYLTSVYGDSDIVIIPNSTNTSVLADRFTSKGYVQTDGNFVGSKSISLSETNGNIPSSLNIKNQNITLSIPANTQFKQADNITNYDGIIGAPVTKPINSVNDEEVLSAFKVGSTLTALKLTGGVATLLIPVAGQTIGDHIQVYYSQDNGTNRYLQTTTNVINVGGQPYVEFTTNHFTDFAITIPNGGGSFTGSFTINNDAITTTGNLVTLDISTTPAAVYMRFSNTGSTGPRTNREPYSTSKSRTLDGSYGDKTVYAQFDVDGNLFPEITTNDSINYIFSFTGSSLINNNDVSTTSDSVILNISTTPMATQMRFSNTEGGPRSDREPYATTKERTLSPGYAQKTVYTQFDADGNGISDAETSDTINHIDQGGDTSHGSATGNLWLEIITSSGSCSYGTSLYIGSHPSQFAAYDMTGSNFSSSFSCVDTEGLSGWTMTMEATTDLSDGAQTISKDNVSLIASPNYVSAGACTTGTNQDSWVSIGSTPGTILWKSSGQGDICTITSDTVNLAVHIPASQAVGLYTGTLTLNMPF